MKVHMVNHGPKPHFLLFWKKQKLAYKTLCGRKLDTVLYTTDTMAINCKSCKKLMR